MSCAMKKLGAWLAAVLLAFAFSCVALSGQAFAQDGDSSGEEMPTLGFRPTVFLDGQVPEEGMFQFEIRAVTPNAPLPASTTATNVDPHGMVKFDEIVFTEQGTYEYSIVQIPGDDKCIEYDMTEWNASVVIGQRDDGLYLEQVNTPAISDDSPAFSNKTVLFAYPLSMKVELAGGSIASGEFQFRVDPLTEGAPAFSNPVATCDAQGNIDFGTACLPAGTYKYVIRQVAGNEEGVIYDGAEHVVELTVTEKTIGGLACEATFDGGADVPVFHNSVEAQPAAEADAKAESNAKANAKAESVQGEIPRTADGSSAAMALLTAVAVLAGAVCSIARKRLNA